MTRVATVPMHRTLFDAISRSQQRLADVQVELATGKRAQDFASLGTETVRNLSARTLVAKQEANATVATRVTTSLSIYDANISGIDSSLDSLRNDILTAIGTGKAAGLQEAVEAAFQQFRSSLNASEGGLPMFGGAQTNDVPFTPSKLADTVGLPAASAFTNDGVKASARVSDGLDIQYGITASDIGTGLFNAFKTIAEAGPIGETPTAAQLSALSNAVGQINDGLTTVRSINAENGRKQAQVESLASRAQERTTLLKDLISKNEDADMADVASELVQRRTILEASYTVFSQLSNLSLVNYMR